MKQCHIVVSKAGGQSTPCQHRMDLINVLMHMRIVPLREFQPAYIINIKLKENIL